MGWVFTDSDGETNFGRILDKRGSSFFSGWMFLVGDESAGNCDLIFFDEWTSVVGRWDTTARDLPLSAYHHVLATYDSDSDANNATIYVDGVSKAVTEVNTPAGTRDNDSAKDLTIGNDAPDQNSTFDGKIAYVAGWDVILNATEIQALANGVNPQSIRSANLVFFLPLWGNQSPEPDYDAQLNTGTVSGAVRDINPPVELLENHL